MHDEVKLKFKNTRVLGIISKVNDFGRIFIIWALKWFGGNAWQPAMPLLRSWTLTEPPKPGGTSYFIKIPPFDVQVKALLDKPILGFLAFALIFAQY